MKKHVEKKHKYFFTKVYIYFILNYIRNQCLITFWTLLNCYIKQTSIIPAFYLRNPYFNPNAQFSSSNQTKFGAALQSCSRVLCSHFLVIDFALHLLFLFPWSTFLAPWFVSLDPISPFRPHLQLRTTSRTKYDSKFPK